MSDAKLTLKIGGDSAGAVSALKKVDGQMAGLAKGGGALKGAFAAVGIAGALALGKQCVEAARKAETSTAMLRRTVENAGGSWDKYGSSIEDVVRKQMDLAAFDDEDLQDALRNLVRITGDVDASMKMLGVSSDLARNTGKGVAEAATMVAKAYSGQGGQLKRTLGLNLEGKRSWEAIDMIQRKVAGSAEDYGNTAAGAAERAQVAVENLKEAFGGDLVPGAKSADEAVTSVANAFSRNDWLRYSAEGVVGVAASLQALKWGITTVKVVLPPVASGLQSVALQGMYAADGVAAIATSASLAVPALGGLALVGGLLRGVYVELTPELRKANEARVSEWREANNSALIHRKLAPAVRSSADQTRFYATHTKTATTASHGLTSAVNTQTGAVSKTAAAAANAAVRALELANAEARTGQASRDASRKVLDYQDSLQRVKDAKAKVNELEKDGKRNTDEYRQAVRDAERATLDSRDSYEAITGDLERMAEAYKGVESAAYKAARAIGYSTEQASLFSVPPSMRHAAGTITTGPEHAVIGEDGTEVVANISNPRYHDRSVQLVNYAIRALGMNRQPVGASVVNYINMTFPVASREDGPYIKQVAKRALSEMSNALGAPVMVPGG